MMHHQKSREKTGEKVVVEIEVGVKTTGKPQYPIYEAERLLKWEKIFYQAPQPHSKAPTPTGHPPSSSSNPLPIVPPPPTQMDQELRGYLFEEETVAFYTFIRLDLSRDAIEKEMMDALKTAKDVGQDDQMVVLSEFLTISEGLLSKCSSELVDAGVENFMSSRAMIQTRHNRRWRLVAARIDEWCRVWIPIFYVTSLLMIFNLSTDDGYTPDENGVIKSRVIFTGLPPIMGVEGGVMGWARILALPILVVVSKPMIYCARKLLIVSLTKNNGDHASRKRFGLKGWYTWVDPEKHKSWAWLLSTAHQVDKTDPSKFGPKYTATDLDRLIGYKIYPDQRSRNVEMHENISKPGRLFGATRKSIASGKALRPLTCVVAPQVEPHAPPA